MVAIKALQLTLLQKRLRRNDLNASERMEGQEVGITCDNVRGSPAYRKFKEFVVPGVTASSNSHIDVSPLSLSRQNRNKNPNIVVINVAAELLSAQDVA